MITKDERTWKFIGFDSPKGSNVPALVFKRRYDSKHQSDQYEYICSNVKFYLLNGDCKIISLPT